MGSKKKKDKPKGKKATMKVKIKGSPGQVRRALQSFANRDTGFGSA